MGIPNICWWGPLVTAYPAGGLQEIVANATANATIPQPNQFNYMMYVFIIDPTSTHSGFSNGQHDDFSWNGANFPFGFAPFSGTLGVAALPNGVQQGVDGPTWWSTQASLYTGMISHEVYEMMTDPVPNSGWVDNGFPPGFTSECCDICEDLLNDDDEAPFQYGPWQIESYWSNADNICVLGFGNTWTNVGNPGVALSGAVALGQNAVPGGLQLFAAGTDGNLWTFSGNPPDAPKGVWYMGQWSLLADGANIVAGPPVAAFNPTTFLQEVFASATPAPGAPAQLWHVYQTAADGAWSAESIWAGQRVAISSAMSR